MPHSKWVSNEMADFGENEYEMQMMDPTQKSMPTQSPQSAHQMHNQRVFTTENQ